MRLRFETGKIKPTPHGQSSGPGTQSTASSPRNSVVNICGGWRVICLIVLLGTLPTVGHVAAHVSAEDPAAVSHHQPASRRFERALARVQPLVTRYGYGAVALAVFAEGVGIPMPGQTLLIATALEAAVGRLSITLTLAIVTLAAALGNCAGYVIGRWGGRRVLNKLKVNPGRQQRLDEFFLRRGGLVILVARFVDGLRQLNGIVAGISRMPWWTFTAYNVAGAVLWTLAWGLGAYYLERDIHLVAGSVQRHRTVLLVLAAAALVALLIYLFRRGKESKGIGLT
jgi:membrane protein DedA with SNARE-associated domain